ncbi:MAG: YerC/YecD family TrpR-related protein [Candidatus Peribacteraceae bacterium]|jgi:TrpR-related protein YerC/YecD|nr:DNA-binding transcriptional regulator [bacterium]MDP6561988.1 YerC/YecD family TrpR-related protein [Candidatus Peribacteraceae bacterium]|tara:strand:- start:55 stop:399 length:345 start_codon:yes stop_codon:yes gene_type:complete
MPKKSFTEGNWKRNPWFRALCKALLSCKSEQEMAGFLRDIATLSELKSLSERLEMAKQLAAGRPQRDVAESIDASTTTVARVSLFLKSGTGYKNALNALHHHLPSRRKKMASMV